METTDYDRRRLEFDTEYPDGYGTEQMTFDDCLMLFGVGMLEQPLDKLNPLFGYNPPLGS